MSRVNEQDVEDGVFQEVEASCAALVPLSPCVFRPASFAIARPDASFVTHLMATAEKLPQTRELRRAAPAEVLSAYRSFEKSIRGAPVSRRQTI